MPVQTYDSFEIPPHCKREPDRCVYTFLLDIQAKNEHAV
jgi:hypothetical protein